METKEKMINPVLYELVKKCEVKRIYESLTKRELTDLIEVHYVYYYNCVTGSNNPSPKMIEAIKTYLNTPTINVYESIFARRRTNPPKNNKERDENGREPFHHKLKFHDGEVDLVLKQMKDKGNLIEPKDYFENQ